MAVQNGLQCFSDIGGWIDAVELARRHIDARSAQFSAPTSCPANNAFFRVSAISRSFCPYRARSRGPLGAARVRIPDLRGEE